MFRPTLYIIFLTTITGAVHADEPLKFDALAKPFLKTHCLDCHGVDIQEGDVTFHKLAGVDAESIDLWHRIWEQVAIKEMPPEDADRPEPLERYRFTQWLIGEFDRMMQPADGFRKHKLPEKGNHVDHDLLFGKIPEGIEPPSTPARTWRIHPDAYLVRINELVHKTLDYNSATHGAEMKGFAPIFESGIKKVLLGKDHVTSRRTSKLQAILPTISVRFSQECFDYALPRAYRSGLGSLHRSQDIEVNRLRGDTLKRMHVEDHSPTSTRNT